jgi:hypothetical protein
MIFPITCRSPRFLSLLLGVLACVCVIPAFIPGKNGQPLSILAISVILLVPAGIIALAFIAHLYRVTLEEDRIVQAGISQKTYLIADVVKIEVRAGRGSMFTTVTMKDGRRLSLPDYATNYQAFVSALRHVTRMSKQAWELY